MQWVQEGMKEEEWRDETEEGKDMSAREGGYEPGEEVEAIQEVVAKD